MRAIAFRIVPQEFIKRMSSIVGFWDNLDKEWDAINRSILVVQGDSSLIEDISAYKLYVNGNVHGTGGRFAHLAPPNSVYTRLEAGVYRIVLREYDASKPNRIESNTLYINIRDDEQIAIRASLQEGQLILSLDDAVAETF
jgi:hypothetical protein